MGLEGKDGKGDEALNGVGIQHFGIDKCKFLIRGVVAELMMLEF